MAPTRSSLCNFFPLRIYCTERVIVFMHTIQKPATEKILVRGLQNTEISEHMLLCMLYTWVVNHIPMVSLTISLNIAVGNSKIVCSV